MRSIPLYAVTVLLAAAAPAGASTLYKCLDPVGKPVYSDRPCEGRPAKTIKVAALPTPVARDDDEAGDEETGAYDEPDDEPVEETDAQVYARKAQERRADDLKRKQAAAAMLRSKERPPQVKRP